MNHAFIHNGILTPVTRVQVLTFPLRTLDSLPMYRGLSGICTLRGKQVLFPGIRTATLQNKIIGCTCQPHQQTALYAYVYEWMDRLIHSFIKSKLKNWRWFDYII